MKTALVMGITGGFGGHVAQALARKGYTIRALMRDPAKLPERFKGADICTGDAANIDDVRAAAEGVELIVYGINPPKYRWEGVVVPLIENTARVAEEKKLTVVFPGNVYVFDPKDGPVFDETSPHHPISTKGRMRTQMEARLQQASQRGARIIIIRMGDFIGQNLSSAWLDVLIKPTRNGYRLAAPGPRDHVRTWAYLPDVGRTVADLVDKKLAFEPFSVFHFRGYQTSFNEIARLIEQASGKKVMASRFPWFALRVMSPFSNLFRGLMEMRYLWDKEINLNESRLQNALGGQVPHTPLANALIESGLITHRVETNLPVAKQLVN